MRKLHSGRRLIWAGALALFVPPSLVFAQGKPAVGPPVTAPETNRNAGGDPAEAVRPPRAATPDEVLPPVAETPSDPAPFGTRGVPAIGPRAITGRTVAPGAIPARGARLERQIGANVVYAEGVVTRVQKPAAGAKTSRLLVTIDTTRNWEDHLTANLPGALPADEVAAENAATAPGPKTIRAEGVDAPGIPALDEDGSAPDASGDRVVPLVITTRTHLYTFGRTREGVDRYGLAMFDSPNVTADTPIARTPARRPVRNAARVDLANIRPGAYVSVRYRRAGDTNEALNFSLVQASPDTPDEGLAPDTGVVGGGTAADPEGIFDNSPRVPRVPNGRGGNANTLPR